MTSAKIDNIYEDALSSGLLPGCSIWAGDKNGNQIYSSSFGKSSLKPGQENKPFDESTICLVASLTKLMTSVAVLKAVELGKVDLDTDVRSTFPRMGQYGIITGFDDEKNSVIFEADSTPITLRMLLSHTSGHEYDWLSPVLGKWRASRNEVPWAGQPWPGATVEDKSALPLTFKPGTGFAYGAGHDWAGKAIEIATGFTLDEFMKQHIWTPLGIERDASFFPKQNPDLASRLADLSMLSETGEPPATEAAEMDMGAECMGGAGAFCSSRAYSTFLSAVFRRDNRLLTPASYNELFRPQLDEKTEQAFNEHLASSPVHTQLLSLRVPPSLRKSWSFAGMVCLEGQEGRFEKGTTMWAGVPNCVWWMDHKAGVCGTAICQILPPLCPPVVALHENFQRAVLEMVKGRE